MRTTRFLIAIVVIALAGFVAQAEPLTEEEEARLGNFIDRAAHLLPRERVEILLKSQLLLATDLHIEEFAKASKLTKSQVRDLKKSAMFVPPNKEGIFVYVDSKFIRELIAAPDDTVWLYALAAMLNHEIEHLIGENDETKAYAVEIATLKSLIERFDLGGLDRYLAQLERIAKIATLKSIIESFNIRGWDRYLAQLEQIAREEGRH